METCYQVSEANEKRWVLRRSEGACLMCVCGNIFKHV